MGLWHKCWSSICKVNGKGTINQHRQWVSKNLHVGFNVVIYISPILMFGAYLKVRQSLYICVIIWVDIYHLQPF